MAFTKLYLTTKAPGFTPATIRGAWDQTAGAIAKAADPSNIDGGAITTIGIAETSATNNFDVLLGRWITGPLAAQTLSGTINVILGVLESNAGANDRFHLHIYVTQGDTDTPRGTILTNYVDSSNWPTTATGKALASAQTLTSLAISAGDRIVIELGYVAVNTSTTSFTGTLNYGTQDPTTLKVAADLAAAGTDVTTKAGTITFSNSITEVDSTHRVSQLPVTVVSDGTKGEARVSQASVTVVSDGTKGEARVSQASATVVSDGTKGEIRASQFSVTLLTPNSVSPQRVSQLPVTVVSDGSKAIQVSQLAVFVLSRNRTSSFPALLLFG